MSIFIKSYGLRNFHGDDIKIPLILYSSVIFLRDLLSPLKIMVQRHQQYAARERVVLWP